MGVVREGVSAKRHHLSRDRNNEEEEAIRERKEHSKLKEQERAWQPLECSGWSVVNAGKKEGGRRKRGTEASYCLLGHDEKFNFIPVAMGSHQMIVNRAQLPNLTLGFII